MGSILVVLAAVPSAGIAVWYGIRFLPYLNEIHRVSERGNATADGVRDTFYPVAVAGETKLGLRQYATRQAYQSLVLQGGRETQVAWQLNTLLWYVASFLHLTDDEIFGVWVDCSTYGCGRGLSEVAQKYLGNDLAHLTPWQCAQLVAVVKAPSIFVPGSERGDRKARQIFERYNLQLEQMRGTAQPLQMIPPQP